jgi:tRNA A37 threonylcarbamoyladenosine dehydratase
MQSTIGLSRLDVIKRRLHDINPEAKIIAVNDFLTKDNMRELIHEQNVVIDAMDAVHIKAKLAALCSAIKVRLIVVGSSGGKRDPSRIAVADLGKTESDPMLAKLRSHLYRFHNFSRDPGRKFRIDAVYSSENMVYPKPDGTVCTDKSVLREGVKLDCAGGFGSSVMVTGSFGFLAAARAIERYLSTATTSTTTTTPATSLDKQE